MKKNVRKSKLSNQPSHVRRAAYTLAAGAAACAASGGGEEADAAIVYSGLQNINVALSNYPLTLDLDGDTFNDLGLKNFPWYGGPYQGLTVFGTGSVKGFFAGYAYVSNLAPGTLLDSSSVGPTFFGSLAYGLNNPNAEFNTPEGTIGLSFGTSPNLRYGWIRVAIDSPNGVFTVKDWAYSSEYNTSIRSGQVPEPGTLGMLAAGAAGVLSLRRRRKEAA